MKNSYKCYVISLARLPEKRSDFLERNRGTGLRFEVFEAVDGSKLTIDECVQKGFITASAVRYTLGMIGCAASHHSLWKEAETTQSNLLVFEDDAYCRHDIADQIQDLLSSLPDWDIILLGSNTNAVLDFKISEHFNFAGFFSNRHPSHEQLQAFTKDTGRVVAVRLNNAMGSCSYLVSPQGARKLISLFPMDNRLVFVPGDKARSGRDTFRCITGDMMMNTLYPRMNAYVAVPPLVIPRHDHITSTTHGPSSGQSNPKEQGSPQTTKRLLRRVMKRVRRSVRHGFGRRN